MLVISVTRPWELERSDIHDNDDDDDEDDEDDDIDGDDDECVTGAQRVHEC